MPNERLNIVITESGGRRVETQIDRIGGSAERTESSLNIMKKALVSIGAAVTVRGVSQLVDTYQSMQNRIRTVTDSAQGLATAQERLFNLARDSRGDLSATVETYVRLRKATLDLGTSDEQLYSTLERVNKVLSISGATTVEAEQSIRQLSQAFSKGKLDGDEFRSVSENLPDILTILQKSLGVTQRELRKMSEEGQITAAVMIKAFEDSGATIDRDFAESVETVGQKWQKFTNQLLVSTGEFLETSGTLEVVGSAIMLVTDNLDALIPIIAAAAATFGTVLAAQALTKVVSSVGKTIKAMQTLNFVMAANPVTILITSLAAGAAAFGLFSKAAGTARGSLENLRLTAEQQAVQEAIYGEEQLRLAKERLLEEAKTLDRKQVSVGLSAKEVLELEHVNKQLADVEIRQKRINDAVQARVKLAEEAPLTNNEKKAANSLAALKAEVEFQETLVDKTKKDRQIAIEERKLLLDLTKDHVKAEKASAKAQEYAVRLVEVRNKLAAQKGPSLSEELDKLRASLNPLVAVEQERAKAQLLIDKASQRRLITNAEEIALNERLTLAYKDRIAPGQALLTQAKQELADAKLSNAERDKAIALREIENELIQAGGDVTLAAQILKVRSEAEAVKATQERIDSLQALRQAIDPVAVAEEQHAEKIKNIIFLRDKLKVSEEGYVRGLVAAKKELDDVRSPELKILESLKEEDKLLQARRKGGKEEASDLAKKTEFLKSINDLSADQQKLLIEQYDLNAQLLKQIKEEEKKKKALADAEKKAMREKHKEQQRLNKVTQQQLAAIGQAAAGLFTQDEINFKKFLATVLAGLAQIAIQKSIVAGTLSSETGAGLSALLGGLAGSFAHGGSFTVNAPGSGPDKQLVAFRASHGERVDITPPGQSRLDRQKPQQLTTGASPVQIINVVDPREAVNALGTKAGERRILNTIARNQRTLRRFNR